MWGGVRFGNSALHGLWSCGLEIGFGAEGWQSTAQHGCAVSGSSGRHDSGVDRNGCNGSGSGSQ